MEAAGTDTVRAVGDNWVLAETKSTMMGSPFTGILTLGYDAQKEQFIGTWIDSMGSHLWVYEGTLNDAGDTLTLTTTGPSMEGPDTTARYKEVITIKGPDQRTFSSSIELESGEWVTILTAEYRRKN